MYGCHFELRTRMAGTVACQCVLNGIYFFTMPNSLHRQGLMSKSKKGHVFDGGDFDTCFRPTSGHWGISQPSELYISAGAGKEGIYHNFVSLCATRPNEKRSKRIGSQNC